MKCIYEGKAKTLFETSNEDELICYFKDSVTAFNGKRHDNIDSKGILNNKISELIFLYLHKKGIKTHFIKRISDREQLIKKVKIIPLEVIIRNISSGSFARNFAIKEGVKLPFSVFELSYKKDELSDPLINMDHAIALNIVTKKEYNFIKEMALKINNLLIDLFKSISITLVDFKLEFGKLSNGEIILADEFSPDNSRLWDLETNKKLDKDNYRQEIGDLKSAYNIVLKRLQNVS